MTRRIILIAAFALVTTAIHAAEKPPKMETRLYPITETYDSPSVGPAKPALTNVVGEFVGMGDVDHTIDSSNVRQYLQERGLKFPDGSNVMYDGRVHGIIMRNTAENHIRLRKILAMYSLIPTQVELDFSVVTFPPTDIEAVARKSNSAAPSQAEIIELWKSGKGKLEASQKISTHSGINVQMQQVEEIIYPTDFKATKPNPASASNDVSQSANSPIITPGEFETREVGIIVNVTPTISPDGKTIDLVMAPELSELEKMADINVEYGSGTNVMHTKTQEPIFDTSKVTTSICIRDGETHVTGGMANHANDGWRYFFITARIVDASGGKPGETDDSILLDDGSATPAK